MTLPTGTNNLLSRDSTDQLTNKSLKDTTVLFINNTDSTKKLGVDLSSATTSTKTTIVSQQTANRTITLPDDDTTLVGTNTTQTISNKNFVNSQFSGSSVFSGGMVINVTTVTANTILNDTHYMVRCDAVTPITVTLPDPLLNTGRVYVIVKIDISANVVTIHTPTGFIRTIGNTDVTLSNPYAVITIISDSVGWLVC